LYFKKWKELFSLLAFLCGRKGGGGGFLESFRSWEVVIFSAHSEYLVDFPALGLLGLKLSLFF
jgi:hypothetical protein